MLTEISMNFISGISASGVPSADDAASARRAVRATQHSHTAITVGAVSILLARQISRKHPYHAWTSIGLQCSPNEKECEKRS